MSNTLIMKKKPIFWIPSVILFIINLVFLLIIFILKNIGKGLVWVNNNISDAGTFCTEMAQGETKKEKLQAVVDKFMGGK